MRGDSILSRQNDDFIMLPTVDFCFKELMNNAKVRKGFVAAILGKDPNDEKYYRVIKLCDKESGETYSDLFELHILELKKLPPEAQNEDAIIQWMRFFSYTIAV